ncbi:hypothetical protein SAMN05443144_101331 [Fodinibius roseus]|uniref:Uncharacterized protein n=1 Tax=Fodinibius roseus TaxID=1194090 RepID=A0A1M4TMG0_9BACT|nr:hypothetical protein SAMN05443144_101331 [Fodinibius roseus]
MPQEEIQKSRGAKISFFKEDNGKKKDRSRVSLNR